MFNALIKIKAELRGKFVLLLASDVVNALKNASLMLLRYKILWHTLTRKSAGFVENVLLLVRPVQSGKRDLYQ